MHEPETVAEIKHSESLLSALERRAVPRLARAVPACLQSWHLTMLTLVWSALVLAAALLATRDARWLWLSSGAIGMQYLTDAVDGKVGRFRGDGLVGWGYYMDHLLDYVFLCSILLGYALLLPPSSQFLMLPVLAIAAGFMVSSFLARSVTGVLTISCMRLGPIEIRLIFIAINTYVILGWRTSVVAAIPAATGAALLVFCVLVYRTQRTLWELDRAARFERAGVAPAVPAPSLTRALERQG